MRTGIRGRTSEAEKKNRQRGERKRNGNEKAEGKERNLKLKAGGQGSGGPKVELEKLKRGEKLIRNEGGQKSE